MNPEQSVIVPAVLSIGLLFSIATLARDAIHRLRGDQWLDRRATLDGHLTASLTSTDSRSARADRLGRRHRAFYALLGAACIALAVYLALGSYGNYIGWTGWVETIGWIWLSYWFFIAAFAYLGVCSMVIAIRWTSPPAWTRPLLTHLPLSSVPARHPSRGLRLNGERRSARRERPLDARQIDARVAALARTVAAVWTTVAVIVLTLLALQDRLPQAPDPGILETAVAGPVQIGLLAMVTIGSLLTGRHEALGAAIMAAGSAVLAFISAVQYPPWVAVLVAIALGTPAFLHWLAWQRDRHLHHLVTLAVATALLVGGVGVAAGALYDSVLGPAHPESGTTVAGNAGVTWVWAGGTTPRSSVVVARLDDERASATLVVSDGNAVEVEGARRVPGEHVGDGIVRFAVEGLHPDRTFAYGIELDGVLETTDGTFRTFPEGPASFTIAFGACARTGSNGAVFDAIREHDPLLYVVLGDFNYANTRGNDLPRFLGAYSSTLSAPAQAALYRSTSVAYVWDDHDYGGNDADAASPSRPAAQRAYRLAVPHYPIPSAEQGIYQSFPVGRLRFILTDLRSNRVPAPEVGDPRMLGSEQLAWFERELELAASNGQVVVWGSASPWIQAPTPGSDTWGGFAAERERIAATIARLDLADRLVMLGGDAHMIAYDGGANAAYAGPTSGFPVLHAGALDRPGGIKGGPYEVGPFPGPGHFGLVEVFDDGGDTIRLTLRGRTWEGIDLVERERVLTVRP